MADVPEIHTEFDDGVSGKRIAVYTSVFGDYDTVYPPQFYSDGIDYFYISDHRPEDIGEYKWIDARQFIPMDVIGPVKKNRWVKMHPHIIFPRYECSIYVDGVVEITKDISGYLHRNKTGISVFKYYNRDCLYFEALQMVNYKRIPMEEVLYQIERYLDEGFPMHYGMTEMPVIARFHHNPICIKLMEDWWNEFNKTALRDQLSFMYVMWRNGLGIGDLSLIGIDFRMADEYNYHQHIKDSKYVLNPNYER